MFLRFLDRYRDFGLLVLRLGVGFFYVYAHGGPKILAGPDRWEGIGGAMRNFGMDFFPVIWGFLASFTELAGGILLILGLLFRPAAMLLAVVMLVAMVMHISQGDSVGTVSHSGKMLFVFIGLVFVGPGKYSLDARLK